MGPQHAYGLAARLEQVADHPLSLNQGTLYPALVRLEQKGWIKGAWQTTENNREAKYYTITRAGARALESQTERWRRLAGLVDKLLLHEFVAMPFRRFLRRLAALVSDGHAENELAREMRAHLTLLEDDFRRRGLSADDARLAARRAFGGVEQAKERQRDARSFVWLADAQRDMRHAARLLRRDPLFTATAVLSLAIGIGANTTIVTVGNALLFRAPAAVADPGALVDIGTRTPGGGFGNSSYPNYLDVRRRATTLEGVYASGLFPRAMSLSGAGDSSATERVFATPVTGNYFAVLGTTAAAGRLFDGDAVDRPGTDPVIVLSHRFWTRRFNRDPSLIGRTILLNRESFTVIGVAAEGFQGPGVRAGDLWVPMTMSSAASSLANRTAALFLVGGRLKRGVSIQQAAAELDAVGKALALEYPAENRGRSFLVEPLVAGARRQTADHESFSSCF